MNVPGSPRPTGHLDSETLAVYLEGRCAAGEAARIEAHLAACDGCRELFAACAELVGREPPPRGRREGGSGPYRSPRRKQSS
jgi:hypothetical protein